MNPFYLTLPSDSSTEMYPGNSQCCFKVKLPRSIHIDKETWEVALAQLVTPSQFLNISEEEAEFHIITANADLFKIIESADKKRDNMITYPINKTKKSGKTDRWGVRFKFPAGSYTNPSHVLDVINEMIQNNIGKELYEKGMSIDVIYTSVSKRPQLRFKNVHKTGIKFHPLLFLKLGGAPELQDNTIYPGRNVLQMFKYSPNLDAGYNHLFIYSDIAEHSIVGDTIAPILRVTPFKTANSYENDNGSQHINHEITNLQYVPISKSEFDTIHIKITGDSGLPVQFVIGKTIVKLHFRQRSDKS